MSSNTRPVKDATLEDAPPRDRIPTLLSGALDILDDIEESGDGDLEQVRNNIGDALASAVAHQASGGDPSLRRAADALIKSLAGVTVSSAAYSTGDAERALAHFRACADHVVAVLRREPDAAPTSDGDAS